MPNLWKFNNNNIESKILEMELVQHSYLEFFIYINFENGNVEHEED